jgi:hypothetical protein
MSEAAAEAGARFEVAPGKEGAEFEVGAT